MSFNKININKLFYSFVTIHLILWTFVPSFTNNNLPLDTIEALAWGSNLDWGFNKHPPASAFFLEVFYQIFGPQDWAYYLLSQIFVVIAFIVVFKFAQELLKNKTLRTTKIISLAGSSVFEPSLIKARINGNIDQITAGKVDANSRIISGSVLHGHKSDGVMNYLGFYDSQISAIPDEVNEIFMNWLMPGSNLHSKLNVFLSSFVKPKEFIFNTSIGGGNRAIIPINSYEEVIPMDILVTQLLKSLVVADTEMAIDLGMLELIPEDLALCSYVCPSNMIIHLF